MSSLIGNHTCFIYGSVECQLLIDCHGKDNKNVFKQVQRNKVIGMFLCSIR